MSKNLPIPKSELMARTKADRESKGMIRVSVNIWVKSEDADKARTAMKKAGQKFKAT